MICTLLLSFFIVGCAEQTNVDSVQKDEELTNKIVPTLTTTSWEILSEKRNAKYEYPSMVEFSPQILKKDAENKTIEQISEELISLFMQHISTYNGESTFRLTEYENVKVNAAETKGKAWKENY